MDSDGTHRPMIVERGDAGAVAPPSWSPYSAGDIVSRLAPHLPTKLPSSSKELGGSSSDGGDQELREISILGSGLHCRLPADNDPLSLPLVVDPLTTTSSSSPSATNNDYTSLSMSTRQFAIRLAAEADELDTPTLGAELNLPDYHRNADHGEVRGGLENSERCVNVGDQFSEL